MFVLMAVQAGGNVVVVTPSAPTDPVLGDAELTALVTKLVAKVVAEVDAAVLEVVEDTTTEVELEVALVVELVEAAATVEVVDETATTVVGVDELLAGAEAINLPPRRLGLLLLAAPRTFFM